MSFKWSFQPNYLKFLVFFNWDFPFDVMALGQLLRFSFCCEVHRDLFIYLFLISKGDQVVEMVVDLSYFWTPNSVLFFYAIDSTLFHRASLCCFGTSHILPLLWNYWLPQLCSSQPHYSFDTSIHVVINKNNY